MSSEEEPVAWLRQRIRERLYLAKHAIELGNAAEWTELSSGVLMTVDPDAPQDDRDTWDGVHPMGDSSLTRLMEANDPQDTIARCEEELAILDEHASDGDAAWPECVRCADTHPDRCECGVLDGQHWRTAEDYPCKTVRLLAGGYRRRPGYREEWKP